MSTKPATGYHVQHSMISAAQSVHAIATFAIKNGNITCSSVLFSTVQELRFSMLHCHIAHKTLHSPGAKTWNVNPAMRRVIVIVTSPEFAHLSDGIFVKDSILVYT